MINFTLFIIFLSFTLFVFGVVFLLQWVLVGKKQSVSQRLAHFSGEETIKPEEIPFIVRDEELSEIPLLNRLLKKLQFAGRLQHLIDQSGMTISVGQLVLRMVLFGIAGVLLNLRLDSFVLKIVFPPLRAGFPMPLTSCAMPFVRDSGW
jgi:hypothetical protein